MRAIRSFYRLARAVGLLTILGVTETTLFGQGLSTTFIPAPARVDMVHDAQRDILYITSGSQVLRYDVAFASFIPS
jgi:hypothetical protein